MKRVIWTFVITLVVLLAIPLLILATGVVNMAASNAPGMLEKKLATFAVERSLAVRAPNESNPLGEDPQAIATGLSHYKSMCMRCHGGPGVQPEEFAKGLNPPAPKFDGPAKEMSEGELFRITKDGVRMTGMPAFGPSHKDDDIWMIVAFLKQLPNLSAEQKHELEQGGGESHEHGSNANQSHNDNAAGNQLDR